MKTDPLWSVFLYLRFFRCFIEMNALWEDQFNDKAC